MKTALLILFIFTAVLPAQVIITKHDPPPNILNETDFSIHPQPVIPDLYRVINGETQRVDKTWFAVSGQVAQVHPGVGVRIQGSLEGQFQTTDFLVVNLPFPVADGEVLPPPGYVILVKDAGTYNYSTAGDSTRTIRKYDYGIPWTPPPLTPEQLAAMKTEAEAKKKIALEKVLEHDQSSAAKDEADGLERMAERYWDGNGVETNRIKARIYFMRASEGGNLTASNKLAHLQSP
jgi:hypothetical protein